MQDEMVEKTIKVLARHGISDKRYIGFVLDKMEYDGNWEPEDYISAVFQDIIKEKNHALCRLRIAFAQNQLYLLEEDSDSVNPYYTMAKYIKLTEIWEKVKTYWENKLKGL